MDGNQIEGFAFLSTNGKFVHISEHIGHTGRKLFVSEVDNVNKASVFVTSNPSILFGANHKSKLSELKLTPVKATVTRVVTIG